MKYVHNILNVPIFNIGIIVHIGDVDSLKKELYSSFGNEKGNEVFKEMHFSDDIIGKSVELSTGALLLWVSDIKSDIKSNSVLAHEIFHTAVSIMLKRDIPLNNSTEEVCAYLIGYLTECIQKFLSSF